MVDFKTFNLTIEISKIIVRIYFRKSGVKIVDLNFLTEIASLMFFLAEIAENPYGLIAENPCGL